MERVDILVLRRKIHGANADLMDIRVLHDLLALLHAKVSVKDCNGKEVCARRALERSGHLNHPVDHFGAVFFAHIMSIQRGRSWDSFILSDKVLVDFCEKCELEIFRLRWGGLLRATKTLVTLLRRFNRSSLACSTLCQAFNLDDLHWVLIEEFLSDTRPTRNMASQLSSSPV